MQFHFYEVRRIVKFLEKVEVIKAWVKILSNWNFPTLPGKIRTTLENPLV